jgi:hypothetical protein
MGSSTRPRARVDHSRTCEVELEWDRVRRGARVEGGIEDEGACDFQVSVSSSVVSDERRGLVDHMHLSVPPT